MLLVWEGYIFQLKRRWDNMNQIKLRKIRHKKSVELANVQDNETILDLGCGDCKIKDFLPDVNYIGIDFKSLMTDHSYLTSIPNEDIIDWNLESGLPPIIKKKKFDVIFLVDIIEHLENFRTLLKQCRDILSDNGRIIISTPSWERIIIKEQTGHIHCFKKTNMKNLADVCGLKVTEIIGSYIIIPVIHLCIVSKWSFYSDNLIYRLEVDKRD